MKKQITIQYEEVLRRMDSLDSIQQMGIELHYKKSMGKITCGAVLGAVGVVTLPLPTGSVFLIAIGLSLMSAGGFDIWGYKKGLVSKLRFAIWKRFGWCC
jgi:hypothetical protein